MQRLVGDNPRLQAYINMSSEEAEALARSTAGELRELYEENEFKFQAASQIREISGLFDGLIENRADMLGTEDEAQARQWIEEFRLEVERTRAAYPGVDTRGCRIESTETVFWIHAQICSQLGGDMLPAEKKKLVDRLMFGDEVFAQHFARDAEELKMISAPLVFEWAQLLSRLDPKAFSDPDSWRLEQIGFLRSVYQEAAAAGELLLVQ